MTESNRTRNARSNGSKSLLLMLFAVFVMCLYHVVEVSITIRQKNLVNVLNTFRYDRFYVYNATNSSSSRSDGDSLGVDHVQMKKSMTDHLSHKQQTDNSTITKSHDEINCGCPDTCTQNILTSVFKKDHPVSCEARTKYLMGRYHISEEEACKGAVERDYCPSQCKPDVCEALSKDFVLETQTPEKITCGCPDTCKGRFLYAVNRVDNSVTCEARTKFLIEKHHISEEKACKEAVESDYCPSQCNPTVCEPNPDANLDVNIVDTHPPFHRYDGVAIVTKVLGVKSDIPHLQKMICTANAAYNRFVNYDFIVFMTLPFTEEEMKEVRTAASQANIIFAIEGPPLEERLSAMSLEERAFHYKRCNVEEGKALSWFHHCSEPGNARTNNLAYCWQAQFRAVHIWTHEKLKPYKYMIWLDTDAIPTITWQTDPIQIMVENDLVLLYDSFGIHSCHQQDLKEKMLEIYNTTVCRLEETEDGHLVRKACEPDERVYVKTVYGFHHVTNLDAYRKDIHQRFLHHLVSEYSFSRKWDDQLAVALVGAMEDPSRCWDMRKHNVTQMVRHHWNFDGKEISRPKNIKNYWSQHGRNWTAGRLMCDDLFV